MSSLRRIVTVLALSAAALVTGVSSNASEASDAAIFVHDLPLTVLPVNQASPRMALMLSGDGGWAGLDKEVAAQLVTRGVPVVGVSTLKYFWKERTPEETAKDMARVLHKYLATWKAQQILLIGYSFGADVMPFIVNRLPPDLRARIVTVNLLAMGQKAGFEVHVSGWLGGTDKSARDIGPELDRMGKLKVLCLHGSDDDDSIEACKVFARPQMTTVEIGDGHHFGYLYGPIADRILDFAGR